MAISNIEYDFKKYRNTVPDNIDSTGRMVILGKASDGPVMSPVPVRDPMNISSIFGNEDESRLTKAGKIVFLNGVEEVILMRISGKEAEGRLFGLDRNLNVVDGLKLKSIFGGEKYNEIKINLNDDSIVFEYEDFEREYKYDEYPTLGTLSYAINNDANEGLNYIYTHTNDNNVKSSSLSVVNDREVTLNGGEDGLDLDKNDLYIQLENAYSILSDYPAEIFLPIDAYIDDTYPYSYYNVTPFNSGWYANPKDLSEDRWLTLVEKNGNPCNFGKQLVRFCKKRQDVGLRGVGVIGTKPFYNEKSSLRDGEFSHISKKLSNPIMKNSFRGIADNLVLNNLYLLNVVGSDSKTTYGTYSFEENGALNYASLLSKLSTDVSPTNKRLENTELAFEYQDQEIEELDDMSYVIFRDSIRKGVVPVNGITMASAESGLHYLTSVRTLQGILSRIESFTDPMIGEPIRTNNNFETIDEEIDEILAEDTNVKDYNYDLTVNDVDGYIEIRLELSLYYEINKIKTNVRFNIS